MRPDWLIALEQIKSQPQTIAIKPSIAFAVGGFSLPTIFMHAIFNRALYGQLPQLAAQRSKLFNKPCNLC